MWRATRELRDKKDLAVGLGGGARGRRGLDGMCTAMKTPPVWRVPEGPEGLAGLRDRRLRAEGSRIEGTTKRGLAAVPVGGGRAWPGFEIDHSEPQARVWRSRGRAAAHRHAPPTTTTSTHNDTRPRPVSRPRPRRAQSVPLSKAAPPAIRRSCPRGPQPRRGRPRGGRRGRGRGSRTRSRHPRCGRSGSTAGRHRARHTRRA